MSQAPNTLRNPSPANSNGQQPPRSSGPLALLEPRRQTIAGLLAADKPEQVERFMRSAAFALARNPTLADCSPASIIESVCTAAELKLDFTPSLGLAYLVPYKSRCQFQIGYRGLVTLAIRSGTVRSIEAHVVHANDTFEHEMGTEPRITHRRPALGQSRGEIVGAYAIATLPDGTKQADVMDLAEIDRVRDRSKSGSGGPWGTDYPEMAKKTVVKRLAKYLNLSPEMGKALEHDNDDTDLSGDTDQPRPSNTDRLRAVVVNKPEPMDQPAGPTHDTRDAQAPPRQAQQQQQQHALPPAHVGDAITPDEIPF